ncbi:MAG TPA: hypothetical protein VKS24_20205 [Bradyrhizobium sp.]|nr:hypothetical protein [Bradyrhizobium sp.]
MSKLSIRLLILSITAAGLVAAPIVTPVEAATKVSKVKKTKRTAYRAPPAKDPGANPFSHDMYEDFDRKNAGGGGY